MFRFISAVSAVYFYHRHTKKFLGIFKPSNSNFPMVAPIGDISKATNFKIRSWGPMKKDGDNTPNEDANIPINKYIRITNDDGSISWNTRSGALQAGLELILYDSYSTITEPYQMNLTLNSDLSMTLMWRNFCFKYNEKDNNFLTGDCKDIKKSSFDLYEKKSGGNGKITVKEIHNLRNSCGGGGRGRGGKELSKKDVIEYHSGSSNIKLKSSAKAVAKKIVFKDLNGDDQKLVHKHGKNKDMIRKKSKDDSAESSASASSEKHASMSRLTYFSNDSSLANESIHSESDSSQSSKQNKSHGSSHKSHGSSHKSHSSSHKSHSSSSKSHSSSHKSSSGGDSASKKFI